MIDDAAGPSAVLQRGARPSLIESFGINGLYGYRSIALSSDHAATILIARNGTGKTTLLGALHAFLTMQWTRLRNLEFEYIHCKLRSIDVELKLSHNDVIEFLQFSTDAELMKLSSRIGVDPAELGRFLIEEWLVFRRREDADRDSKIYSSLISSFSYDYKDMTAACDRTRESLFSRHRNTKFIAEALKQALADYDIVYLPTYRRVELALSSDTKQTGFARRRRQPKFSVADGSLFTGDIQFGLSDISERLSALNQRIIIESNNGYREISANIINELIDGLPTDSQGSQTIPTEDELRLFFSRLQEGRRVGPFMHVSTPDLDRIYKKGSVPDSSRAFLDYFLGKLGTVIEATKDVELPVDGFISSCNKYLLSREPSTSLGEIEDDESLDRKQLRLNRKNLRVHVESVPARRKIPLDALSSGEKQMVSLFAKLYLYSGRKIVLIDEPELSLSIDWQMHILVDVLNAPLCDQVIAITHSPFVFDNDLEPFARPLSVKLSRNDAALFDTEVEEMGDYDE